MVPYCDELTEEGLDKEHGNLLRGIDKKIVKREGISICSVMFSSQ
jgi:hypothetical protein